MWDRTKVENMGQNEMKLGGKGKMKNEGRKAALLTKRPEEWLEGKIYILLRPNFMSYRL